MGIALFHLLPESIENIEQFYSAAEYKDSFWKKIPLSFFLAFASYSMILFVEKIAFDSHALIDHDHEGGHGHSHEDHELKSQGKSQEKNLGEKLIAKKEEEESDDSDVEEEAMKNVVSSRGKFASFLQMRNSMIDKQKGASMIGAPKDKALVRASMILRNTLGGPKDNEDMQYLVNPEKVDMGEEHGHEHQHADFKPKSNLTPFLLLIALSLHGFFEGIALGIQGAVKDTLFLFIAIISHKWAEAFTLVEFFNLGNFFHKS